MRGSRTEDKKPLRIVSAWCAEEGFCFGQKTVREKEIEIVVIPELLDTLQIKGYVVTIDAMGTQTKIAEKIIKKKDKEIKEIRYYISSIAAEIDLFEKAVRGH